MAKKKEAPATEEIVVVKKSARIAKPVKSQAAPKKVAAKSEPAVVNLYRAELFAKKAEQFNEVYVGATSYNEALTKINSTEAVSKNNAELQSLYLVNNGANPNTIYIP